MQNPSSNPASGRETYTQTIVQAVHAETTPTRSHFPLVPYVRQLVWFFFFPKPPSFFLCAPAVRLDQTLIPHYCLVVVSKQHTHCTAGFCPARQGFMSVQGPDWPPQRLVHMWGFCFWNWENESDHTGPWQGSKCTKRWAGETGWREGKGRGEQGEQESTRLSQGRVRGQLSDFSQFHIWNTKVSPSCRDWKHPA